MKEDTAQLIHNAREMLDNAIVVPDDDAAPSASMLADAAKYLLDNQVDYPELLLRLRKYLQLAARHAEAEGNQNGAAEHRLRLAETFPQSALEHRQALLEAAGRMNRAGDFARSIPLLRSVETLARGAGDSRTLATARIWLSGPLCEAGEPQEALRLLEEVLQQAGATGNDNASVEAAVNAATVSVMLGRHEQALEYARRALRTAESIHDRHSALRARRILGSVYRTRGLFEEALSEFRKVAEAAEKLGDQRIHAIALGNLGVTRIGNGDIHGGRAELERANELFIELGDLGAMANTRINIGASYVEEGLPHLASVQFMQAAAEFERLGDEHHRVHANLNLASCRMHEGRIADAEALLQRERDAADSQDVGLRCQWHAAAGELHAARSEAAAAREDFRIAMGDATHHGLTDEAAHVGIVWAKMEAALEHWNEALSLADSAADALASAGATPPLLLVEALGVAARAAFNLRLHDVMRARLIRALELADELPLLADAESPRAKDLVDELKALQAIARD